MAITFLCWRCYRSAWAKRSLNPKGTLSEVLQRITNFPSGSTSCTSIEPFPLATEMYSACDEETSLRDRELVEVVVSCSTIRRLRLPLPSPVLTGVVRTVDLPPGLESDKFSLNEIEDIIISQQLWILIIKTAVQ